MLYTNESEHTRVIERPLAAGVNSLAEGAVLVAARDSNGRLTVQPSSGTAGEIFVGLAISEIAEIDSLVRIETFEIAVADTNEDFTLARTPESGTVILKASGATAFDAAAGAVAANGDWLVSGNTLTARNTAGAFTVTYRYVPTVVEARRIQGDIQPGAHIAPTRGSTGVIESGHVLFDNFDTAVDWEGATELELANQLATGANGRLTLGPVKSVSETRVVRGFVSRKPFAHDGIGGAGLMSLSF